MAAARPDGRPIVDVPPNVERTEVCALSGRRPSLECPSTEIEWLPSEAPVEFCSWHHAGGAIDWPDEYRAWAKGKSLRVDGGHRREEANAGALRVVNPPNGATYLIDPTLRMRFQSLRLRAISRTGVAWQIDRKPVGIAGRDAALEWPLEPGVHEITASDAAGHRDTVRIYVK